MEIFQFLLSFDFFLIVKKKKIYISIYVYINIK